MHTQFLWENIKYGEHLEDVLGGRIIIKWILEIQVLTVWTEFMWFWTGAAGGLL
jgi:hypothetical protein